MQLISIFKGTPYWVWAVFIYLVIMGIQSTKKRTVSLYSLGIAPTIFIVWSVFSIQSKYGLSLKTIGIFCLFAALSMAIVSILYTIYKPVLSVDQEQFTVTLPGSFIPLSISLIFFATKYTLGVSYALNPLLKENSFLMIFDLAISGITTGISYGRFISITNIYSKE